MIVTHYGRLGPSDDAAAPSDSPYAHFSQTRALQQLRGFSSTGPSRSQSPQYGSGECVGAVGWMQGQVRSPAKRGFHARLVPMAWAFASLHVRRLTHLSGGE